MIVDVHLDGVLVPDDAVIASLTIRTGRGDVVDPPTTQTCSLSLLREDEWPPGMQAGVDLAIDVDGRGRFRGQVSDLALDWVDGVAQLSIQGSGNLARVARRKVGYGAWPQEPWAARVARVFSEAGWSQVVFDDPAPTIQEAARAGGETTVNAQLDALSQSGAAAIVDQGDGSIFVQALSSRQVQAGDPAPLVLDPSSVVYAPGWVQVLDVVNSVQVAYGPEEDSHTATSTNPDSIDLFGERTTDVGGTLASANDARARGAEIVNRRGYPRWVLPSLEVLGVVWPVIGRTVSLSLLPTPSPVGAVWDPMVEGWTDTLDGDDWTTTLALSDPVASGVTLPWQQVPAFVVWADVECRWEDAYALENLTGSQAA